MAVGGGHTVQSHSKWDRQTDGRTQTDGRVTAFLYATLP